jgi:AcrR family transcriptional regulator
MPAPLRREAILSAAEEVFARSGYHGASLDDIAQAAGISKALIYEHFTSKRELHASLVNAHVEEIFRRLQANAETGTSGEERLRGGIDAFLSFVEEHREAWRALFRDAADPETADIIDRVQTRDSAGSSAGDRDARRIALGRRAVAGQLVARPPGGPARRPRGAGDGLLLGRDRTAARQRAVLKRGAIGPRPR